VELRRPSRQQSSHFVASLALLLSLGLEAQIARLLSLLQPLVKLPVVGARLERVFASTDTLLVHNYPGDYYRFSLQAMREVLLGGLEGREVTVVMRPPRIVGSGRVGGVPLPNIEKVGRGV